MDVTHAALLFIAVWLLGLTLRVNSQNAALRDAARQHDFQEMAKQMTELSTLQARLDERSQAIQLQLAGIQEYLQRDRK